jgi:hypothetical protein
MTASMQMAQYANRCSKATLVREVTALLGLLILKDQFKVGGIILGPQASLNVFPPKSSAQSLHAMLKELELYVKEPLSVSLENADSSKSDPFLESPFSRVEKLIHRGQHVFLISDFLSLPFYADLPSTSTLSDCLVGIDARLSKALSSLGRLSQKAEFASFFIVDPLEKEGLTEASTSFALSDPKTMGYALWPANDSEFQGNYQTTVQHMHERLIAALSRLGTCIEASTAERALDILHRLFLQPQTLNKRSVRS